MIDANSIKLNDLAIGQYLLQADLSYNKLWSSDSGRNMAGANTGTLIGIFPKIKLTFRKMIGTEIALVMAELNKSSITVTYYDLETKSSDTMSCYAGDIEVPIRRLNSYDSFTASVIANTKRT